VENCLSSTWKIVIALINEQGNSRTKMKRPLATGESGEQEERGVRHRSG
jgi:hypothetical protein